MRKIWKQFGNHSMVVRLKRLGAYCSLKSGLRERQGGVGEHWHGRLGAAAVVLW